METSIKSKYIHDNYPTIPKIIKIFVGALILGLGWQIRGSGTSDPTIVMALFSFYLVILFGDRAKFNYFIIGLFVMIFRLMRRGWGTFNGQTGWPGLYDGQLYDVVTPWWTGYFWLFIVGIAWSGLPSLIFGYFFSTKQYQAKDVFIWIILYLGCYFLFQILSKALIPLIAPDTYYGVYIDMGIERDYKSMVDNLSYTFALIPMYIYIWITKKDSCLIKSSLRFVLSFAIGISTMGVFHGLSRYHPTISLLGIPGWSIWEYMTGFVAGFLIMIALYFTPKDAWDTANPVLEHSGVVESLDINSKLQKRPSWSWLLEYFVGHFFLFLWGFQESTMGMINSTANALGWETVTNLGLGSTYGIPIILIIDLPIYLYIKNRQPPIKFRTMAFQKKVLIMFQFMLVYYYLCFALQFIVVGTLFTWTYRWTAINMNTISFVLIQLFLIMIYIIIRKNNQKNNQ